MCCGIEIFRSLETENVTEGFEVAPAGLFDQTAKRVTFSRLPAQTEMLQTVSCYNSSFSPPYRGIYTNSILSVASHHLKSAYATFALNNLSLL